MKERPIIFNTSMVKGIIEGRKTQTRRLVKEKLISEQAEFECGNRPNVIRSEPSLQYYIDNGCPFGQIGDQLWVRETFGTKIRNIGGTPHESFVYKADKSDEICYYDCNGNGYPVKWIPSIHMPRSACRIVLEITNIRVERLLSISESDCVKEGIGSSLLRDCKKPKFMQLWEELYGEGACLDNPWVWVIEFKVVQGGET